MNIPWDILVASSDLEGRRALSNILAKLGVDPLTSSTVRECKELMASERVGLIFCDRLLADGNCYDLLNASRIGRTKARVVVMSSTADWDEFLEAMRLGAFDVIASPCRATDVEWMMIQALRYERTETLKAQVAAV
jgi:DNA-binding NtrC family response regulator